MRIRAKIILLFLPLLVVPLAITALSASLAARNGVTKIATGFLRFKAEELDKYAQGQWQLLVDNELSESAEFLATTQASIGSFASTLIRSSTELVLAIDETGAVVLQTGLLELRAEEIDRLAEISTVSEPEWIQLRLGGIERVAQILPFEPFGWVFLVSEQRSAFYQSVSQIYWQSGGIAVVTIVTTILLLVGFSVLLTKPLRSIVDAMRKIIISGDLSRRVEIEYQDETGELGHTFNLMTGELEKAYTEVKSYALKAAVAERKERKVRNIFQKYVPQQVIGQFFASPESLLTGDSRVLAILFSDVRSFTSIAEKLMPDELVESLNRYFEQMVDAVMERGGIVDKYIGDAVMAFFGAPVKRRDEPQQSLLSAFDMLDRLTKFNKWQVEKGRTPFQIGIGINYGVVTVGNIGSERKLDYTVIGDTVNLANRLEGLTKLYKEPIVISESMYRYVGKDFPCRQLDRVAVKGREMGTAVYAPRRELGPDEEKAWPVHHAALQHYYNQEFARSAEMFTQVQQLLPGDETARLFQSRAEALSINPPPDGWTGIVERTEK